MSNIKNKFLEFYELEEIEMRWTALLDSSLLVIKAKNNYVFGRSQLWVFHLLNVLV